MKVAPSGFFCVVQLIAGLALNGCAPGPMTQDQRYAGLMGRGEAFYSGGDYRASHQAFYDAGKLMESSNLQLYIAAASRAEDAFCMTMFEGAKADLAANNSALAAVEIDTAVSDSACAKFTEQMAWARRQKSTSDAGIKPQW